MIHRLLSLDVMRGLIMILLAAEACHVYISLQELIGGGAGSSIIKQFFHHPWHGLFFWDLVQPAFMLMAGSALYIATYAKARRGITWRTNLPHVLGRCLKLFICGTALHCVYAGKMVWELWNVLTQLAFTTLIAYLIIRLPALVQLIVSLLLLLFTEFLYRNVLIPGFDQPFTEFRNFGAWFDVQIMGKINSDGWVAINIIPTAAHTIWGVLAGKLLISERPPAARLKILTGAGLLALFAGYALDMSSVTPIIKRISTSSFVLVSGGWVLLILAALHWMNDIKKWNRLSWLFVVVGTNAIFIYLFFETVGVQWVNKTVAIFTNGFTGLFNAPSDVQAVVASLVTLLLEWGLCYWLYKKKIFFKL
jgi:predicted acyltransferase